MLKFVSIGLAICSGALASCSKFIAFGTGEDSRPRDESTPVQSADSGSNNENKSTYTVCALKQDQSTTKLKVCTKEYVDAPILDGGMCFHSLCAADNNSCPEYYVTQKSSTPPENQFCSYVRPMEL